MNIRCIVLLAAGATLAPADAPAQIRASERGAVSQTVDGTTMTIDYARLRARGRDSLFGGVVPWGKVWTGANWAMTLDVNKDIVLNGHDLPAGKYSLWFEVQPATWTAIIDPEPRRFHLMPPSPAENQLRFPVETFAVPDTEVLTWTFPEVSATGTIAQLAWGTTAVRFEIGIHPSQDFTVARDFADQFVGDWVMQTQGMLGERTLSFKVRYERDRLMADWEGAPNPHLEHIWLVHQGTRFFFPVETQDGELWDVLTDVVFEFTPLEGRATRFEMRVFGDELWAVGERVPSSR